MRHYRPPSAVRRRSLRPRHTVRVDYDVERMVSSDRAAASGARKARSARDTALEELPPRLLAWLAEPTHGLGMFGPPTSKL